MQKVLLQGTPAFLSQASPTTSTLKKKLPGTILALHHSVEPEVLHEITKEWITTMVFAFRFPFPFPASVSVFRFQLFHTPLCLGLVCLIVDDKHVLCKLLLMINVLCKLGYHNYLIIVRSSFY